MDIHTLMQEGVLSVASEPPNNGNAALDVTALTVPLIAEDYPAKTAAMWNAAYKEFGIDAENSMMVAKPADAARIIDAFRRDSRYVGGGAGIGFKQAVIPYLDALTPLAEAIGAVNIIKKMPDGTLVGDNTDGAGYAMSLADALRAAGKDPVNAHVLMLGAGGTGRAVGFALADAGVRLTIVNRTASKAIELAESINAHFGRSCANGAGRAALDPHVPIADAIVSVIDDAESPLDAYSTLGEMGLPITDEAIARNRTTTETRLRAAKPELVVSDIRIRKEETAMLRQARELGFPVLDGLPMVVNQGIQAFCFVHKDALKEHSVTEEDVAHVMRTAVFS